MNQWGSLAAYEPPSAESMRVSLNLTDAVATYFNDPNAEPLRVNGSTHSTLWSVLRGMEALDGRTRRKAIRLLHEQISIADCMQYYNISREWPAWALEVARGASE